MRKERNGESTQAFAIKKKQGFFQDSIIFEGGESFIKWEGFSPAENSEGRDKDARAESIFSDENSVESESRVINAQKRLSIKYSSIKTSHKKVEPEKVF